MLLIAGGDNDPQLIRLMKLVASKGMEMHCLLQGNSGTPRITWDIRNNRFLDGQKELNPTAAFIRQDVFAYLQSKNEQDRALAREWFVSTAGWLMSNPQINVFNRRYLSHGPVNKPYVLHLAMKLGFDVADSFVSNDGSFIDDLAENADWISKPVTGGAHCQALDKTGVRHLSYPQIIRARLEQPELRVFRIGKDWFGFNVISDALDYRSSTSTTIRPAAVPDKLIDRLTLLSNELQLEFAAADFKTDPETGRLQFLEINTNPMFVGFDQFVDGDLCNAMLRNLSAGFSLCDCQ